MPEPQSDPRYRRSRHRLQDAMMKLVAEKTFASLAILDVTRQAGLNRSTFYLHYGGLPELLEDCTRALFGQMRAEIYANQIPSSSHDSTSLVPFIACVFRHLQEHEKFYRSMLGKQGDPLFRGLFQELLAELIFEPIIEQASYDETRPQLEMTLRFFSAGFTGVAAWWLEKGQPIPADEASQQIARDLLPDYLRLMNAA